MFKVDFIMDKHPESVFRSKMWNLLGMISRVWPAGSDQQWAAPCGRRLFPLLCHNQPSLTWMEWPIAYQSYHYPEKHLILVLKQFSDRAVDTYVRHKGHMWKGMLWGNRWRCNHRENKKALCWETASPEGPMSEQGSSERQGSMEENEQGTRNRGKIIIM